MKINIKLPIGIISLSLMLLLSCQQELPTDPRQIIVLDEDWQFINKDIAGAENPAFNSSEWEKVAVPHDWAISGEFDKHNDSYEVQILEDGDKKKQLRYGLSGGLPHVGVGWYRKNLDIGIDLNDKRIFLEFDGVMSNAKVYFNGKYVGEWPYGYASFGFDVTEFVNFGGDNVLAVRAENLSHASRWYPGAGIYREVRMVVTAPIHVQQWGTYVTTPQISNESGKVNIKTTLSNPLHDNSTITLQTTLFAPEDKEVASAEIEIAADTETSAEQTLEVDYPKLWSAESPNLYVAVSKIIQNGIVIDEYKTSFGFRTFEFTTNDGFFLNGKLTKINGVCLHHDLGPLGAATNIASLRHRMNLLKEMGANAIRTSHNPPTPELLDLADQMGFLIVDEIFDEWEHAKVENGYNRLWSEWAEKDMVSWIHRDRNHPSVIMWSIGNEIREQKMPNGANNARFLVDIAHREDPSRPTTAGFNNRQAAIDNGLAAAVDVVGWNYEPKHYQKAHDKYPQFKVYGSETASTIGSRGIYKLPAIPNHQFDKKSPFHLSAYALNYPSWGNTPDLEFKAQDEYSFMPGEFVWTGFDYLGEPTPFYEEWPSRSSYFGIIDLCGIPKDRYFLYQSQWSDKDVLHLLPHWNWAEGDSVPVHCFTSFDKAELFVNGKSMGIREKSPDKLYTTYRLIWENVPYESGELKVVAFDQHDHPVKETSQKTAGEPAAIRLEADRTNLAANSKDLAFVTVSVVDANGTICPNAENLIRFTTEGPGWVKAVGNGDPTSLESFVEPYRKAFSGKCMAIIEAGKKIGPITFTATSESLESQQLILKVN